MRTGSRWKSTVCDTEVIVIRASAADAALSCGGRLMSEQRPDVAAADLDPDFSDGTEIGKRYVHEDLGIEVLCTKGGKGSLSIGDRPMATKAAKALPTSD